MQTNRNLIAQLVTHGDFTRHPPGNYSLPRKSKSIFKLGICYMFSSHDDGIYDTYTFKSCTWTSSSKFSEFLKLSILSEDVGTKKI